MPGRSKRCTSLSSGPSHMPESFMCTSMSPSTSMTPTTYEESCMPSVSTSAMLHAPRNIWNSCRSSSFIANSPFPFSFPQPCRIVPQVQSAWNFPPHFFPDYLAYHAGEKCHCQSCGYLAYRMHAQVHAGKCDEKRVDQVNCKRAVANCEHNQGECQKRMYGGAGKVKRAWYFARCFHAGALFLQEGLECKPQEERHRHCSQD